MRICLQIRLKTVVRLVGQETLVLRDFGASVRMTGNIMKERKFGRQMIRAQEVQ